MIWLRNLRIRMLKAALRRAYISHQRTLDQLSCGRMLALQLPSVRRSASRMTRLLQKLRALDPNCKAIDVWSDL